MKKKGQITMESLLLYGAAILVVLLAVAALTYFGVLDLGKYLPTKCNFEGTGIFACNDHNAEVGTNTVNIELINKGSKGVTIDSATFDDNSGLVLNCALGAPLTITPGAQEVMVLDCPGADWNAEAGNRISGTVTMRHTFTGGSLESTTKGDIVTTVSD